MKILLQNTKTGLYHTPRGEWDHDVNAALVFANFRSARDYVKIQQLARTKLVALAGGPAEPKNASSDDGKTHAGGPLKEAA